MSTMYNTFIDTSIPIRRNVEEFEMAQAQYAIRRNGPELFEDYPKLVVYAAVAYTHESNTIASQVLGVKKATIRAGVNLMRKPVKKGRRVGQCAAGHDLSDPDNAWQHPSGKRQCKLCYKEKHPPKPRVYELLETCKRGHDMNITRVRSPGGQTYCRECNRERAAQARAKKKKGIE